MFLKKFIPRTHLSNDIMLDQPHPMKYVASRGVLSTGGDPTVGRMLMGQNFFNLFDDMASFLFLTLGKSFRSCLV
jgi:hypothetical protein